MKDKTKKDIINSLIDGTKNGTFTWKLTTSCFNNDSTKEDSVMSLDGKTEFKTTVALDDRTLLFKSSSKPIVFYNAGFVDGHMWIFGTDGFETELIKLQKLLYELYTKATVVYKNENDVLNDILSSVGDKVTIRDKKIDSLLGNIKSKLWF